MNNSHTKIAVITGATGYVGFEIAKKLAADGFAIAMLYHTKPQEEVQGMLSKLSGEGHQAYACDLTSSEEVAMTLEKIKSEMGNAYAYIHAAGRSPMRGKLSLSSEEELRAQLEQNVVSSFNFLTASAKSLKEHGGVLIGITTAGVVNVQASLGLGAYTPAKFAVQGMLTMLREELAMSKVRVYAIAPGFMEGGMNAGIPKAFVEMIKDKSPTKKIADAADIARVVADLCANTPSRTDLTIVVAPELGL